MMMDSLDQDKQTIAARFGRATEAYHAFATVQKQSAKQLISLAQSSKTLPEGPILEIGCGTGFVTQELVRSFPHRSIEVTDLSSEMLQFCREHLQISPQQASLLSFHLLDGEVSNCNAQKYALIAGGFVLQWFRHPEKSILNLLDQLLPDGQLLLSFPTCHSFSEWRQVCQLLNLPFTANALPDAQALMQRIAQNNLQVTIKEASFYTVHNDAAQFFRELKAIGAGFSTTRKKLSVSQMKQLIQVWNQQSGDKIQVHHHIAFCSIQRD